MTVRSIAKRNPETKCVVELIGGKFLYRNGVATLRKLLFRSVAVALLFIFLICHNYHDASADAFASYKSSLTSLRSCGCSGSREYEHTDEVNIGQKPNKSEDGGGTLHFRSNVLKQKQSSRRPKGRASIRLLLKRGGTIDPIGGRNDRVSVSSVVEEEWKVNPVLNAAGRLIIRKSSKLWGSLKWGKDGISARSGNSLIKRENTILNESKFASAQREGLTELIPDGPHTNRVNSSIDTSKLSSAIESLDAPKKKQEDCFYYYIREARYKDLTPSASILYDGFFDPKSLFKSFGVLKILDRLQSNYPYGDREHFMFVAAVKNNNPKNKHPVKEEILGFADVDARFMDKQPPKPYLSDLAVHPQWRRRGIARALMMACERKAVEMGFDHLYLRVDLGNEAAIQMYGGMEYDIIPHHLYGKPPYDTTLLLKRTFSTKRAEELARLPLDFLPSQSRSLLLGTMHASQCQ